MSVQSELKKIKSILKNGDKIFTKVVPNCFCKGVKEPLIKARRAFNSGSSYFLKLP